jgi:hypothetical protein
MAYTTIDDPSAHFQANAYSGSSNPQTITNDGNSDLQPDFLWSKRRDSAAPHYLFDSTRGVNSSLSSDDTDAVDTATGYLASFNSDGFTTGSDSALAYSGRTYVAWQWKANGGTTSSNNDGSYTSTVQANTTAGFSIVKYGDASSFSASTPATVGHGLGKTPKWIIIKNLDGSRSWGVHHVSNGAGKIIYLDLTNAVANSTGFDNGTLPTSSVFTVNTLNVANGNNLEYIAYCFAEIQGYSKFGSYTGNGSEDGPFVYLGFKPQWILFKNTGAAEEWVLQDTTRNPNNPITKNIRVDSNIAEGDASSIDIDFLSNGFKNRSDQAQVNSSGVTYIYMAFAEHPFVSSKGVPTTAR